MLKFEIFKKDGNFKFIQQNKFQTWKLLKF